VLQRARALLSLFEGEQIVSALGTRTKGSGEAAGKKKTRAPAIDQLGLFSSVPNPIVEELKKVDPNELTPIEALALLNRLVGRARQG